MSAPRPGALALMLALLPLLQSCGENSSTAPRTEPKVATTLELSTSAVRLTAIGDTATVKAIVKDQFGAALSGVSVSWSSSNTGVVKVQGGLVSAIANGVVSLTATSGALNASASITVTQDEARFPEPAPGQMVISLQNQTGGVWPDSLIYIAVLGRHPQTQRFNWLNADGQLVEARVADNDAPGHLTKQGVNYSNYFTTLDRVRFLKFPKMDSGRLFISLGNPMYIKILQDGGGNVGFAGPNLANASDPNINLLFEWVEFTFNDFGFFGNTTQVDQFGFPVTMELIAEGGAFRKKVGITESRASIFSAFRSETPAEFRHLVRTGASGDLRIVAPGKGGFEPGGTYDAYFAPYVDSVWTMYANQTATFSMWNGSRTFTGTVVADTFRFEEQGVPNVFYYIRRKPTTIEILEGSGVLASGNGTELAIQAQICAAFNRHVMDAPSKWTQPAKYYTAAPSNFFAAFWHRHSIDGLAYGFAYDDVSEQSTLVQRQNPRFLTLGVRW